MPTGRAINPVSKANWEGTGVKPDIETPAELALKTAQRDALEKLQELKKDDPAASKQLGAALEHVKKELEALKAKAADSRR